MTRLYKHIGKQIKAEQKPCPICKGSGYNKGNFCVTCHGKGKVTKYK